ncbi:MAG TPA: tetratricopeptide repeat protein [Kofleriaceae bacterium]|nr:tetratricopeptide repeat protein [Kofleriaceae bacterium]
MSLAWPAHAWAEPKTPDEWYKEGENQYLLGNFDKAIEAFKQAFSLETNASNRAAYLYNIAQAYRQENDCKNALFFYRRFLSLKDQDTTKPLTAKTRKDVEDKIADLEKCVQQATTIGKKPPSTPGLPPDAEGAEKAPPPPPDPGRKEGRKRTATGGDRGPEEDRPEEGPGPAGRGPHVISARATFGATQVNAGDVGVGVRFATALTAGYPIAINDKMMLDVGAVFTFTPVPVELGGGPMTKTASLIGLVANGGVSYLVAPKIALRGDAGLGALFLANAGDSKFTNSASTTGALTMFHVRAALSADYAITPNVIATATPIAFTWSPPKDGLDPSIKSITTFDFMIGIGYRM